MQTNMRKRQRKRQWEREQASGCVPFHVPYSSVFYGFCNIIVASNKKFQFNLRLMYTYIERNGVTQYGMNDNSHICILFDMSLALPLLLLHNCVTYYIPKAYCFSSLRHRLRALCGMFVAFACVLFFGALLWKRPLFCMSTYRNCSKWLFVCFFRKKNDNRLTWILVLVTNYSLRTQQMRQNVIETCGFCLKTSIEKLATKCRETGWVHSAHMCFFSHNSNH